MSNGTEVVYELNNALITTKIASYNDKGLSDNYLTIHKIGSDSTLHCEEIDGVSLKKTRPYIRDDNSYNINEIIKLSNIYYVDSFCVIKNINPISSGLQMANYFIQVNELDKLDNIKEELGVIGNNYILVYICAWDERKNGSPDISKIEIKWRESFSDKIKHYF